MTRYAIRLREDNLDLIETLNDGIRPQIEEQETYFVLETDASKECPNEIISEDALWNKEGTIPNVTFV